MGLEHRNDLCMIRRKGISIAALAVELVIGEGDLRGILPLLGCVDDLGSGGLAHHAVIKAEGVFGALFHINGQKRARRQLAPLIGRKVKQPHRLPIGLDGGAHQRVRVDLLQRDQPILGQIAAEALQDQLVEHIVLCPRLDKRDVPDIQLRRTPRDVTLKDGIKLLIIRRKGHRIGALAVETVIGEADVGAHPPILCGVDHHNAGGFSDNAVIKAEGVFRSGLHRCGDMRSGILVFSLIARKIELPDRILRHLHHRALQRVGVDVHQRDQALHRQVALEMIQVDVADHVALVALFEQLQVPDIQLWRPHRDMGLEHGIEIRPVGGKAHRIMALSLQFSVRKFHVGAQAPCLRRIDDAGLGRFPDHAVVKAEGVIGALGHINAQIPVGVQIVPLIAAEVKQPDLGIFVFCLFSRLRLRFSGRRVLLPARRAEQEKQRGHDAGKQNDTETDRQSDDQLAGFKDLHKLLLLFDRVNVQNGLYT